MKTVAIKRRSTRQREVILEALRRVKTHPTADALFQMVRRRLPRLSFGTVYRNLNLLRDEGRILELACGRYSSHYDGDIHPHYHFFCLKCEGLYDVERPVLKNLDEEVSEETGLLVKHHHINFYGLCKGCK